eukprot:scaffold569_cov165-Amphora_coffeaeformis.AAC.15
MSVRACTAPGTWKVVTASWRPLATNVDECSWLSDADSRYPSNKARKKSSKRLQTSRVPPAEGAT